MLPSDDAPQVWSPPAASSLKNAVAGPGATPTQVGETSLGPLGPSCPEPLLPQQQAECPSRPSQPPPVGSTQTWFEPETICGEALATDPLVYVTGPLEKVT